MLKGFVRGFVADCVLNLKVSHCDFLLACSPAFTLRSFPQKKRLIWFRFSLKGLLVQSRKGDFNYKSANQSFISPLATL